LSRNDKPQLAIVHGNGRNAVMQESGCSLVIDCVAVCYVDVSGRAFPETAAMSKILVRIAGAIAAVAASFFATTFLIYLFVDKSDNPIAVAPASGPCVGASPVRLAPPFDPWGGFAFGAEIPKLRNAADSEADLSRSKLVVCEDGNPLGPPHSLHDDIREKGLGRYSHWGTTVIFSASDNSNPNMNSRSYSIVDEH
jgi:hypothetical protein